MYEVRQSKNPIIERAVEQLFATIDNDPQVLLETKGGPVGLTADVIVARLFGYDEQIDHEWVLSGRIPPVLLTPIIHRPMMVAFDGDAMPSIDSATYHLQSIWAQVYLNVAMVALAGDVPASWRPGGDSLVRMLGVRYRRSVKM